MTEDLDRIMRIMDAAFDPAWGEAWNRRQVSDSLAFSHTHYHLIAPDGSEAEGTKEAVGFTMTRAAPGEEELLLVAVMPHHRGRGLGETLIRRAIGGARSRGAERLFLETRDNNPAIHLYRSIGFQAIGIRKEYYNASGGRKLDAITFAYQL
jgi:ribosomal-protein-alanine N-acetyltransferase